jgi:hypothetical protein
MKPPKKVTYVISGIDYSLGFLWLATFIDRKKYNPSFIFIGKSSPSLIPVLTEKSISCRFIQCSSKWNYPLTFIKLWFEFLFKRPDIVHAQLVEAGLLTLPAALFAGIKIRNLQNALHLDYVIQTQSTTRTLPLTWIWILWFIHGTRH